MLIPIVTPLPTPPSASDSDLIDPLSSVPSDNAKADGELSISELMKDDVGLTELPGELFNATLAYLISDLPSFPAQYAATIGTRHYGIPHVHPLTASGGSSVGSLSIGGCASVLINDQRAARLGDLGTATSCGAVSPTFLVTTGSSTVFIGGARAARSLDVTRHCGTALLNPLKLAAGVKVATQIVEAGGDLLEGVVKGGGAAIRTGLRSHSSSKPMISRMKAMKARAEGLEAMAVAHEAAADGHSLALQTAGEQSALDLKVTLAGLTVGLDPALPPCFGMLFADPSTVWIGGFPTPDIGGMLNDLITAIPSGIAKIVFPVVRDIARVSRLGKWVSRTLTKGRLSNLLPSFLRRFTGHPVDVVAGRFVLDALDAELPGALPLRLARFYSSTWGSRPSPFGHGWSHTLDEAIWREPGQLVYRAHDGRELEFPLPTTDTDPTTADEQFDPLNRLTLRPLPNAGWQIEDHEGILRDFRPLTTSPDAPARLIKIHDPRGRRIDLVYTDNLLTRAHTPDGREIKFHYHPTGHIARIDLPDPDGDGLVPHAHYDYDGDDLVAITDALGHVTRYRHDNHRITEETLPGGLRFHFDYDGPDTDAACTRTRGDGGIIDHTLIYDRPRRTTMVTNACKEVSVVRYGPHGEPLTVTDARGATTTHEYDLHLRRTATHDPLGRTTRHSYDARGNCTRTVAADGATTTVEYDRDLPVAATDPAGGRWRWSHDAQRRLTRRTDPLGRTTTYHHDDTTTTVVHPDGRRDRHTFHPHTGALLRLEHADGRVLEHTHDRRGRKIHTTYPDGTHETFNYDLLGRLTRHTLPNGDTRNYSYDALGNLVRRCDARTDLRCTYTGLRWLASCGDAHTAPFTLERDLEGRVLRIADAAGTLYHAERDACGALRTVTDARGPRRLTRDLAGRITAISTPDGTTRYTRDQADRITEIHHPDDTRDTFNYRPDGLLLTATRHTSSTTTTTRRELDAAGRLLREWQDDRWIALTHDVHDRITHLRSSHGADLRFNYSSSSALTKITHANTWTITSEHDRHGREHTRQLPGGITAWWHRDAAGRPVEHGVTGSRPPQIHRHRRYAWTADHLTDDLDLTARPRNRTTPHTPPHQPDDRELPATVPRSTLRHDALGRCIADDHTRWQWYGDHILHAITTAPVTWLFPPHLSTPTAPLARLSTAGHHTLVTAPNGHLLAFDEHGAAIPPILDLPPTTSPLDTFGRRQIEPSPTLDLLAAELAPDHRALPTAPPLDTSPRETAVLAAVFRTPPTL